jgi:hypothetical protein
MPATSVRDLVVHNDDIVVGTHGRSFWILDDITPLREVSDRVAAADVHLFRPQVAYRFRRSLNTDTPIPPDEPMGKNPPDGAIINYYLKSRASGPVTLEILDSANRLVRRFSSLDKPEAVNEKELNAPTYWVRPPQILSTEAGMQRFVWDLHYPAPEGARRSYPISAIYMDTPSTPSGPLAPPGEYRVKLTAGGRIITQRLILKMDPRVKTPPEGLARQFTLSMQCYEGVRKSREALEQIRALRAELKSLGDRAKQSTLAEAIAALDRKAAAIEGSASAGGRERPGDEPRKACRRYDLSDGIIAGRRCDAYDSSCRGGERVTAVSEITFGELG